MNVFHRSNLALAIFDIVDSHGVRAAEIWAFKGPDLITVAIDYRYERDAFAFMQPPTAEEHHGTLTIEGRRPQGIHVANADDLADAVRRHWWNVDNPDVDPKTIGIGREIERG